MKPFAKPALILGILLAMPHAAPAKEINCALQQTSNWVDHEGNAHPRELFMMYDAASDSEDCIRICLAYSARDIEPNAELFESLRGQSEMS